MNNFSISSKGIGEALLRSASSLSAAGNTLEESIGMIVAMNTTLQDADVTGTAMKTLSSRLRNTAGQLEELDVDAEGAAESVTKLQTQLLNLTGQRVNILLDDTTFKRTYQIVKELASVWDSLTDVAQADITRLVAGVRQTSAFSSLMQNMNDGIKATETALNSTGSAFSENEKYLDSVAGKISLFTSSFQSLANTVINTDFIKNLIDSGTSFIDVLEKIIKNIKLFPTLMTAASIGLSVTGKTGNILTPFASTGKGVNIPFIQSIKSDVASIKQFNELITMGVSKSEAFDQAMKDSSKTAQFLAKNSTSAGVQVAGLEKSLVGAKLSAVLFSAAATVLNAAITFGLSIAIQGLITFITHQINKSKEAVKAAQEAARAYTEETKSLNDYAKSVKSLREELDSGNLSQSEAYEVRKNLYEIQQKVVGQYGEEASAINLVTGELDGQIDAIERLGKASWEAFNSENFKGVQDSIKNLSKSFQFDISGMNIENTSFSSSFSKELQETFSKYITQYISPNQNGGKPVVGGISFESDNIMDAIDILTQYSTAIRNISEYKANPEQFTQMLDVISEKLTALKDKYNENIDAYKQYVEGIVKYDDEFSSEYGDVLSAKYDLDIAMEKGDAEEITKAYNKLFTAIEAARAKAAQSTSKDAEHVVKYFKDIYPELESEFDKWVFKIKLEADSDGLKSSLTGAIDRLKAQGINDGESILNYLISPPTGSVSGMSQYTSIWEAFNQVAASSGKTIEEVIAYLVDLGYIQDSVADSTDDLNRSVEGSIKSFRGLVTELNKAYKEQAENGEVSVDTYKKLIAINPEYADLFDVSADKIKLNSEELANLITKIQKEYVLKLASNDATEEEINLLFALSDHLKTTSTSYDSIISKVEDLVSVLDRVSDGYEYSGLEILKLIYQYPELASGIETTTKGYKLQETAVQALIKKTAELITVQNTAQRQNAQSTLYTNSKNKATTDNIDAIFEEYGDTIKTWDDYTAVWEKQGAGRDASTAVWVDGVKEYVESVINESNVKKVADGIVESLGNGTYLSGDSGAKEEPAWLKEFKASYEKVNHLLAMNKITQQEYLIWLDGAYKKAYSNDYAQEYIADVWKYEEEIYNGRISLAKEAYAKEKQFYDQRLEDELISKEEYYNILNGLNEKYLSGFASFDDEYSNNQREIYVGLRDAVSDYVGEIDNAYEAHQDEKLAIDQLNAALLENDAILTETQKKSIKDKIKDYTIAGFEDSIKQLDFQSYQLERMENTENERINISKKAQEKILEEMKYYTSLGYDMTRVEMQNLQEEYDSYADNIVDIMETAFNKIVDAQKESLEKSIDEMNGQEDALDTVLDAVVRHLKRQKEAEKFAINDQIDALKDSYDDQRDATSDFYDDLTDEKTDYYDGLIEAAENASKSEIDGLKNQKDAYDELIKAKIDSLQATKDEDDYNRKIADSNKNISDIQSRIDALAPDDSASARAERLKLEEELANSQLELNDYQDDYFTDKQIDALNKEYEQYEKIIESKIELREKESEQALEKLEEEKTAYLESLAEQEKADLLSQERIYEESLDILEKQIADIDLYLSKEGNLRRDANDLLKAEGTELWTELMDYEYEYSEDIKSLDESWAIANGALDKYNSSQVDVMQTLATMLQMIQEYNKELDALANVDYSGIVSDMKANSLAWTTAKTDDERNALNQANQAKANEINTLLGGEFVKYRSAEGRWYMGDVPLYHKGGLVNQSGLKQNETLAILEDDEAVLTNSMFNNVTKLLKASAITGKSLYNFVKIIDPFANLLKGVSGSSVKAINSISDQNSNNGSFVFNSGDVYIEGNADEQTVKALREAKDELYKGMFSKLNGVFKKKGLVLDADGFNI